MCTVWLKDMLFGGQMGVQIEMLLLMNTAGPRGPGFPIGSDAKNDLPNAYKPQMQTQPVPDHWPRPCPGVAPSSLPDAGQQATVPVKKHA